MTHHEIFSQYASNYKFSIKLFSPEIRYDIIILYAFFRYCDECVDNPTPENSLEGVLEKWNLYKQEKVTQDFFISEVVTLVKKYNIEEKEVDIFLSAMEQDKTISRYETYKELLQYMRGSALSPGRMMMSLIGISDVRAIEYGDALSEAMQMTNFLRDVDEDFVLRDRIYLPKEYRVIFGVTEEMIKQRKNTQELQNLIKHLAKESHVLFEKAKLGYPMLHKIGRRQVIIAARVYRENLYKLARKDFNIFKTSRLTLFEKVKATFFGLWESCIYSWNS
jgi:15-cis-phytoene synthase